MCLLCCGSVLCVVCESYGVQLRPSVGVHVTANNDVFWVGGKIGIRVPLFFIPQNAGFSLFLSLHHRDDRLGNFYNYLPVPLEPSTQKRKKLLLSRKKYRVGIFLLSLHTHAMPMLI